MHGLAIDLCGIRLRNPLVLASGILGANPGCLKRAAREGLGAVTLKSIGPEPRKGHPAPIVACFDHGMLNAVGYSNPGVDSACDIYKEQTFSVPVIASVIGQTPEEFARVVARFEALDFAAYELPVSCPHTPGFGTMGHQDDPRFVSRVLQAVRKETNKPVFVKVPPDQHIQDFGKRIQDSGAAGITAVNTMGPGMAIDIASRTPYLGFGRGGLSGPALKPIAVRCVYDLFEAVDIPIIATGGVSCGADAIEMFMAGATAVGVGSAVYYRGMAAFRLICQEMQEIMQAQGIAHINDIKGVAHGA